MLLIWTSDPSGAVFKNFLNGLSRTRVIVVSLSLCEGEFATEKKRFSPDGRVTRKDCPGKKSTA